MKIEQDIAKLKTYRFNAKLYKIWGTEDTIIEIEGLSDLCWEYDQYNMTRSQWMEKAKDLINRKIQSINKILPNYKCRSGGLPEEGHYTIFLYPKQ